jgi:hypothetical protein
MLTRAWFLNKLLSYFPCDTADQSIHAGSATDLVEWAIALHGMYESALAFISIFKQKNLYIVGCVQCIWDITAYFLLP